MMVNVFPLTSHGSSFIISCLKSSLEMYGKVFVYLMKLGEYAFLSNLMMGESLLKFIQGRK